MESFERERNSQILNSCINDMSISRAILGKHLAFICDSERIEKN